MKKRLYIYIITYLIFVVNCKLEVPIDEPEIVEETVSEAVEDTEIITEDIMNDFTVKPFTEFPAYYAQGNMVYGIPKNIKGPGDLVRILPSLVVEEVDFKNPFQQFFVKDGKVYFMVSETWPSDVEGEDPETITKYCTQENGKISYLTEAKFPEMPKSERVTGTTGEYNIDIGEYNGDPISIVSRDYAENLLFVDGFMAIEGGLLIHAPQGRPQARPDGLLFWPDGKRTMDHWKEPGRFWK